MRSVTTLDSVMGRTLISIDWQGFVSDCDFNQMLGLTLGIDASQRTHITDLPEVDVTGLDIVVRNHCYGCTAGQGSGCQGALR